MFIKLYFISYVHNWLLQSVSQDYNLASYTIFVVSVNSKKKSPWSSRQCVGLLDVRPEFKPQIRHHNENMKLFLRPFHLCSFLAKNLRVNKPAMNKLLKKKNLSFAVDFKLQVPPLLQKMNAHNLSGVKSQVAFLTEGL